MQILRVVRFWIGVFIVVGLWITAVLATGIGSDIMWGGSGP